MAMTVKGEKEMMENLGVSIPAPPKAPPKAPPRKPRASSGQFLSTNVPSLEKKRTPSEELSHQKKEIAQEFDDNAAKCLQIINPGKSEGLSGRVKQYDFEVARKRDPIGWTSTTIKLAGISFLIILGLLFLVMWGSDETFDTKLRKGTADFISPEY